MSPPSWTRRRLPENGAGGRDPRVRPYNNERPRPKVGTRGTIEGTHPGDGGAPKTLNHLEFKWKFFGPDRATGLARFLL